MALDFLQTEDIPIKFDGSFQVVDPIPGMQKLFYLFHEQILFAPDVRAKEEMV